MKAIPRYLYIFILYATTVLLPSCDSAGNDNDFVQRLNLDAQSEVDTAYSEFKAAENNDVIPLANHFFHMLDTNETTDTLIQYASSATLSDVVANADYWMAEYLYQTNRQQDALTLAQVALKEAEAMDDMELQTNINSLLSAIYSRLGMFEEGLRCLQFCLDESMRTGNKENMSSDLNNMAAMFISLKQYDKAKEHIDRAIEIERQLQDNHQLADNAQERDGTLAIRLGIASETYALLGLLDEAEEFAREAYKIDAKAGREGKAAIRLSQLATVLQKKGKTDDARQALDEAMPVLKACGNTYSYIICENQMGDICREANNPKEAEAHYLHALQLSDDNAYKYMRQRALSGLWETLKHTDMERAARYLEQYTALSDTLHTEATERQLANMQAQFEYAELQAQNERLTYQNRVHTLFWAAGVIVCLLIIAVLSFIIYAKNKAAIIARQTDVLISLISAAGNAGQGTPEGKPYETEPSANAQQDSEVQGNTGEQTATASSKISESDSIFIRQLVDYVNNRLLQCQTIDVNDCASQLCVSPRHFSRKVVAITGFTPTAYINRIKINRAKQLLDTHPEFTITEISTMSGFEDLAYFGRIFRKIEGKSPTQYRNQNQQP